jgi:hypothetical protein
MLANPTPGQLVRIRYGKHYSSMMPYHDYLGTVHIICHARRCRNHGILINGKLVFIPCGNLFKVK